jgi:hypothetical protein
MRPRSLATDRVKKSMFSKFSDFSYSNYATLKTKCKNFFGRCSAVYSISTSGSDKLKAKVEVNGRATTALLDTCAEVTLITSSFAQSLNLIISPTSNSIISFDGTKSKPLGKTNFKITQGSKELICENALVVHNISSDIDVLFGWPFLQSYNFCLDGYNNTFTLFEFNPIPYFSNKTQSDVSSTCEIRARSRVIIQPNSHIYIRFNHNLLFSHLRKNNLNTVFLSPSSTLMNTPLRLGCGELKATNKYISISNWSNIPITLEKGALIGYGTSNLFHVFSLEGSDEGIDDSNIYLPTPIQEDFKNFIDDPHRVLTKQEFLASLQKLLDAQSSLTSSQRGQLINFLHKYRFLFSKDPKNPGATTKTTCKVKTDPVDLDPIRCHPYRTSHRAQEELRRQVKEMLDSSIVRKSKSPWAFPVVLAMKSDGTWRFCVDYSKLNKNVPRDSFPLPNVDDHLDRLGKAKIFTVIDLASGFWQIPVDEKDKEKLAFITPFGTYEWNFMPFGFVNAPSIFQRAISETLDPELYLSCLVYVDDIIIYSNDFDSHLADLDRVFTLLGDYNWRIKLSKCQFACETINYLGHRISHGSVQPLERNVDKIKNMKIPSNPEELVSFLGTAAYYKKFICGYDYVIKPLRDLTKPNTKWDFSPSSPAFQSYQSIISIFTSYPVLRLPDFSKPFIVKTDTSGYAWGAALIQVHDDIEHPVQYASGTLNSSQRNWPAWKREMYGSLRAIQKWNHYLLGDHFTLVTDHQANTYLMDPTRNHPAIINNWIILLSSYKYTVVHRPGKTLFLEDALSRSPNLLSLSVSSPIDINSIISKQKEDPILKIIIHSINNSLDLPLSFRQKYFLSTDRFIIENDVLYYLENISKFPSRRLKRLALPKEYHEDLFKLFHDHALAGHLGFERFWSSISSDYWYVDFYSSTRKYYDSCHICNINRPLKHHNSPILPIISHSPFEILQVDHIVVNTHSKDPNIYKYILVCTDTFSKKSWFIPTKSLTAIEAYDALLIHIFSPFFFPKHFLSDLGSAFDNDLSSLLIKGTNISHKFALPNHKGATGQVENRNRLAESILRKYTDQFLQNDWWSYCWTAQYAYNKSVSSIHNLSPDYIIFGMKPFSLLDLSLSSLPGFDHLKDEVKFKLSNIEKAWKTVSLALDEQAEKMVANRISYFHNHPIPSFKSGDLVIIKRNIFDKELNKKLLSKNIGPYEVVATDLNNITLQITPLDTQIVHQDDIDAYKGPLKPFPLHLFTPLLTEIIPVPIPPRMKKANEKLLPDRMKKEFNLKSIVGRRISAYWPSTKSNHDGTVIGYNSELTHNLVFYDTPTVDVIASCDYYKAFLFPSSPNSRVEKWSLYS